MGLRHWIVIALAGVVTLVAGIALWGRATIEASLPLLEGRVTVEGLAGEVYIERDARGVPTVRGGDRLDVARATGFLHAQERFFQMDLQRRRAAGELAALVGSAALPLDRSARVHRFRQRAREILARQASTRDRAILEAYTAGVNAGLAALAGPPFEYPLIDAVPEPWTAEDVLLSGFSMYVVLQSRPILWETNRGVLHEVLPRALYRFLTPRGTSWDAPVVGAALPAPALPGPEVFDLRRRPPAPRAAALPGEEVPPVAGSNNWAVAGAHTRSGAALVANDMHLGWSVPNIWYQASLVYETPDGEARRITGATLPGAPLVIVGSNGRVAWGLTNSMGDFADQVWIESVPGDADAYRSPDGPRRFDRVQEVLQVKGGPDETLEVMETIWGPVTGVDHRDRRVATRWVAHDPRAFNLDMMRLEAAGSVREALDIAARSGVPAQNFTVGDADGHIGWTIIGPIPRRFGHDGRLPSSWADGSRGWDGWLEPREYPRVVDPPGGRIWTANARVVDGEMLEHIGFGGYVVGARGAQIRDGLLALDVASESDMLEIQLDNRALFLTRWRDLLLEILDPAAVEDAPRRGELRRALEDWGGHAALDSVGYRMAHAYRKIVSQRVIEPLVAKCRSLAPDFRYAETGRQQEGPVWTLVSERPLHLLDARFDTWEEQLLALVDEMLDDLLADGSVLASLTWGNHNRARIRHPLSDHIPFGAALLDMPATPLAGDRHMPSALTATWGPSERMVVTPGREQHGIFHMPGGQSGHPLSPFYRAGHDAWLDGKPEPLLPGEVVHTLVLAPGDTPED